MSKIPIWIWILAIVVVFILWYNDNYKLFIRHLPKNSDPKVFGSKYWGAIHSIAEEIPCSLCRDEAIERFNFIHDDVNKKLGKPFFDETNYNYWIKKYKDQ